MTSERTYMNGRKHVWTDLVSSGRLLALRLPNENPASQHSWIRCSWLRCAESGVDA